MLYIKFTSQLGISEGREWKNKHFCLQGVFALQLKNYNFLREFIKNCQLHRANEKGIKIR